MGKVKVKKEKREIERREEKSEKRRERKEEREEKRREGGLLTSGIQNYIRHCNILRLLKFNGTFKGDYYDARITFGGGG